ncbi:hypothetical protein WJX81_007416 [Elliptochloris bilobata]|uniref:Methyltransferase domain-containing protein n=1 Tax=Elliptochloris bilobata TaxID=381761 RepID=A0AAW1RN09_9CHLO
MAASGAPAWVAAGCALPPLVYAGREFCYMQTPLWPALLQDVDLAGPPFCTVTRPGMVGAGEAGAEGLVVSQAARLWLSCAGAVSPLHYDAATSFLTQVRGRKRLLLWEPGALGALKPYPALHILRRRARLAATALFTTPSLQHPRRRMHIVRAGAPSTKVRTEMPQMPQSDEEVSDEWLINLYKGDKIVPWDIGREQPLVAEAVEQGLFVSPVLDVGCGQGTHTIFLGSKGLEATGVDLSPDAIAEAESRLAAAACR